MNSGTFRGPQLGRVINPSSSSSDRSQMLTSKLVEMLSSSELARWFASRAPVGQGMSRRFVPGESVDSAIAASQTANAGGLKATLNYLGEFVEEEVGAKAAADTYVEILNQIVELGIDANISVKPSQLGQTSEGTRYRSHFLRVIQSAEKAGIFVRLDMESSNLVGSTLDMFDTLWSAGSTGVGIVLQASLHRTPDDLRKLIDGGVRIRLCKGAYQEPAGVAIQDVDAIRVRFLELTDQLLEEGVYPAFATHDRALIDAVRERAAAKRIDPLNYEFQMLYGIRRDLQEWLLAKGHNVRVYIPFGEMWYPYLMRRLAERPQNLRLIAKSVLQDSFLGRWFTRPDRSDRAS